MVDVRQCLSLVKAGSMFSSQCCHNGRIVWRPPRWVYVITKFKSVSYSICPAFSFHVYCVKRVVLHVFRCTQEMHEALQMAMTGHARILDQYAELQEKHILLLANMREIRHGVIEYKKDARDSGFNAVEDEWFDAQATQITYMKVEQERFKEQIKGLEAQLDDTADAVQAAGELLVRLKESEQASILAKVNALGLV